MIVFYYPTKTLIDFEKYYVYNIFTTNIKRYVVIGCYGQTKMYSYSNSN